MPRLTTPMDTRSVHPRHSHITFHYKNKSLLLLSGGQWGPRAIETILPRAISSAKTLISPPGQAEPEEIRFNQISISIDLMYHSCLITFKEHVY